MKHQSTQKSRVEDSIKSMRMHYQDHNDFLPDLQLVPRWQLFSTIYITHKFSGFSSAATWYYENDIFATFPTNLWLPRLLILVGNHGRKVYISLSNTLSSSVLWITCLAYHRLSPRRRRFLCTSLVTIFGYLMTGLATDIVRLCQHMGST